MYTRACLYGYTQIGAADITIDTGDNDIVLEIGTPSTVNKYKIFCKILELFKIYYRQIK